MSEVIEYRGEKIPVGWYREQYANFKKEDGSPYFSLEELEEEVQKRVLMEKRRIGWNTGARYEKHQGFHLAFYLKERQKFPEAFKSQVTDSEAKKIICKLARHFKLGNPKRWIRFYGNSQSGSSGWSIRLSHNPSIGLICHELAHQKHKRHDKKLMSLIGRMIRYCKKKGWIKE